ncbi:MAG: LysR family transcriptional regulator [Rhodobacteraceae bacterium]|nr:LysR family transcriptional regulator [Paracoccaceae bacterium]
MGLRLNLEQLRTFLAVARLGGVRAAAEHLALSQPAVSARIKGLEASLATELFERSPQGMRLTKRGVALKKYAVQYLELVEHIERDVVDPAAIERQIRIGVSETIVQSWLPEFICRLRAAYPKLSVEITVDISVNLRASLLQRAIDLALLMGPVSEFTVENVALPSSELIWCRASSQELPHNLRQLFTTEAVVTFARDTRPYRELQLELYNRYGPGVTIFPSSSLSACVRMIGAGLAVGAMPEMVVAPEIEAGRLAPFDPGWRPNPLRFTASYLGEPQSELLERSAQIARETALEAS